MQQNDKSDTLYKKKVNGKYRSANENGGNKRDNICMDNNTFENIIKQQGIQTNTQKYEQHEPYQK